MSGMNAGELAAAGAAVLWTISAMAWTSAGRQMGAVAVSFHRLVIAGAMLSLLGGLTHGRWLPTDASGETWLLLGLSGLMGFFFCDACLFKALVLIGPRLTLLVQSLAPPIAAVLSRLFLGEALSGRHWLAMIITLGGVMWVVLERPARPREGTVDAGNLRVGLALAVIAAATQAVGMVLSRRGIGDYDAAGATLIRILGSLPGYLVLFTVLARWPAVMRSLRHKRALAIMMWGSFVGPFLGVMLVMVALRHAPAGIVTTILATMPVLILPLSIAVYRERVSLRAAAGAVVSVAGVALMCWA